MQKIWDKILFYGLILTLFTPLVIGDSLLFPFVSTKAYFFYIVVDILLIVYLLSLSGRPLYPRYSKLLLGFFAISILGIIFDLFGLSFTNSFWGNYERMMGGYNTLHFLVYLWLLLSVFGSRASYLKLLKVSVVVSFLLAVYGLLQKAGVDWSLIVKTADDRLFATLGNAAYLAGFALIFLFLTAYLFIKDKNIYWRIFYGINFVLNFYIMFATATRGALVALAAAGSLMLLYVLFVYKSKKIKALAGIVLLLMIVFASSIFVFKDSALVQNNLTLKRLSEITLTETTASSRLSLWQMSVEAAKEKPIFGYGQNNIVVPLDRYYEYSLMEDWFDSSHNKFFDELLAHGWTGLALQVAFFLWLFWLVLKKRKQDFWGTTLTLGMLTAYVVQAIFIFDSFIVGWLFIFILGFMVLNFDRKDGRQRLILNKKLPIYIGGIISVILAALFIYIYYISFSPAFKIVEAEKIIKQEIMDKGYVESLSKVDEIYRSAEEQMFFNYDVFAPAIARTSIDIFKGHNYYTDVQLKRHLEIVEKVYQRAMIDSGHYSKFYVNMSKMYQRASLSPRLDYTDKSIELLERALELSPNRVDIYYAMAQAYAMQEDIGLAKEWIDKALVFEAHKYQTYFNMALFDVRVSDPEVALETIAKAEEYGKKISFLEWENFARLFIEREEWQAAAEMFVKMIDVRPDHTDTYFNVALAYAKLGDRAKAIEWINKVSEVDPSLQETVDEFINNL